MIQAAMYFALGLLVAGLVALLVTPAIWRRAMRLARARFEAEIPMTRAEIEADKDELRASFALESRRLEMDVGRLNDKLSDLTIASARQRAEIATLSESKANLAETVAGLEERVRDLNGALATADAKLGTAEDEIERRDASLAAREVELEALRARFEATEQMTEEQRLEMVARITEIGNLEDQLRQAKDGAAALATARDDLAAALERERLRVTAEAKRAEGLDAGLKALQAERVSRLAELERRNNEIGLLQAELNAERARREALTTEVEGAKSERAGNLRSLEERGTALDALEAEIAAEKKARDALLADIERLNAQRMDSLARIERAAGEIKGLESAIAAERAERARLAAEIDGIKAERTRVAAELSERAREVGALSEKLASEEARQIELRSDLVAAEAAIAKAEGEANALANAHKRQLAAAVADAAAQADRRQADAVAEGDNFRKAMAATEAEKAKLAADVSERDNAIAVLNERLRAEGERTAELDRRLAAAEQALTDVRAERAADAARQEAALEALRNEAAEDTDLVKRAVATADAQRAEMALKLAALEDDYGALRAENTELRRVAGAEWESDREENRRLRERLNEIAANVVRLTAPVVDEKSAAPSPEAGPAQPAASEERTSETDLSKRLRALQPSSGARH